MHEFIIWMLEHYPGIISSIVAISGLMYGFYVFHLRPLVSTSLSTSEEKMFAMVETNKNLIIEVKKEIWNYIESQREDESRHELTMKELIKSQENIENKLIEYKIVTADIEGSELDWVKKMLQSDTEFFTKFLEQLLIEERNKSSYDVIMKKIIDKSQERRNKSYAKNVIQGKRSRTVRIIEDMEAFIFPKMFNWIENFVKDVLTLKGNGEVDALIRRHARDLGERLFTEYMYEFRTRIALKNE